MNEVKIKIDDSFTGQICNFAVGFLKFENNGQDVTPAGTGTFAKLGKSKGVVAAARAIENLSKSGLIGFVRFPSIEPPLQNLRLEMERTDRIVH
jgi:hypothetical protein